MVTALQIVEQAKALGFDKCGIIPVEAMAGYEEKLDERMARYPQTRTKYEKFRSFAAPQREYPWAKSIVVCSYWYGKYRIPENLRGRIAKYYLTDGRTNERSAGYKTSVAFERFLRDQGLRIASERRFGVTALRWAAMKAGIGIVRKNNFLYTERGSWQYLEAFLIDQPLQYIAQCKARPCPAACERCIRNCPTNSLNAPFSMDRNVCVSSLTTWDGWDLSVEPLRDRFGDWIYGCDACQDACPFNHNAWTGEEAFPGLEELSQHLSLAQIVDADYPYLERVVQPTLWYIPADKCWRFKTNALNCMLNQGDPAHLPAIQRACGDESWQVRKFAQWVLTQFPAPGARPAGENAHEPRPFGSC